MRRSCSRSAALAGFRDPDGIRPLVVGRLDDAWVLASETCALDLIGARLERELRPGELVVIDEQGARFRQAVSRNGGSLCIFEFIYFARPDSTMEGEALHDVRRRMGARLADEAPAEADVVIGVPDSGTPAAVGYAERSGIPYGEGLVKNRYVGRTFIQPDQGLRERGVKLKFNTLRSALDGRRVVVVDDSIVRGSTTRKLVQLLFEAGAVEVHLRISSPPIVSPCFYGIDMADQGQLIAAGRSIDEVRDRLGATSLAYLSLDGLTDATRLPGESFCRACLTGQYPTEIPADMRLSKLRFEAQPVEARMTDDPLTYERVGREPRRGRVRRRADQGGRHLDARPRGRSAGTAASPASSRRRWATRSCRQPATGPGRRCCSATPPGATAASGSTRSR